VIRLLIIFLPVLADAFLKTIALFLDPILIGNELSNLGAAPRPVNTSFQFDSGVREVIRRRVGYVSLVSTTAITSSLSLVDAALTNPAEWLGRGSLPALSPLIRSSARPQEQGNVQA
jgi:hypothetical protein